MRIYNRYVLFLVIAAGLANSLLAFAGQDDLGVYFIVNLLCYLVITLLYTYLNPRARRVFNTIGIVFFAGFLVIAIIEILQIL
jgi:uncharacterized membrane protein YhhN